VAKEEEEEREETTLAPLEFISWKMREKPCDE
jgi:hypothetical protein